MDMDSPRLLPWNAPDGRRSYLISDGAGHLARLADAAERARLDMAVTLLGHAADLLADERATPLQLRYLSERLAESLADVHQIASTHSG